MLLESHTTVGPNDPTFLQVVADLETGGGTDLSGGLKAAYKMTEKHWVDGRIHRVVLMSDGGANLGVTDAELIGTKAGNNDEDGVYMVGIGTGTAGTSSEDLMDLGRGAALFIPSKAVAEDILGERFLEVMGATTRDVQIRYDLPPGFSIDRFSGEQLSTDPDEVMPQHMAPNDAVVLYQNLSSCSPDVDLDQTIAVTVSYFDGVTFAPRAVVAEVTLAELLAGPTERLETGAAIYTFTETLKHLQGGDAAVDQGEARTALDAALLSNPGDRDLLRMDQALTALGP